MFNFKKKVPQKEYDYYQKVEHENEFVWGVVSNLFPDLECGLYTLNDFDITYNTVKKVYSASFELYSLFDRTDDEQLAYLKSIFDKLTTWMTDKSYDTFTKLDLFDVLTNGLNINSEFRTLEDLYQTYKFFLVGLQGGE